MRDRSESGFTMVEVLVAIMLVGVMASGVISALSVSHVADRSSQELMTGNHLAQEVMESVEVTPYTGLLALDQATVVEGRFTALTSVDLIAVGLIRVQVRVRCADNDDVDVILATLISDPT